MKQWRKIYGGGFHVFEGEQHISNVLLVLPFVVFLCSSFGRCLSGFHLLLMRDGGSFSLACLMLTSQKRNLCPRCVQCRCFFRFLWLISVLLLSLLNYVLVSLFSSVDIFLIPFTNHPFRVLWDISGLVDIVLPSFQIRDYFICFLFYLFICSSLPYLC